MTELDYTYPLAARLMHAGMAIFGITAFLTGELAEHGAGTSGYYLHAYLGLSLAVFFFARFLAGMVGPPTMRFSAWSPFAARQWKQAAEDVSALLRMQVPERGMHQGLAGITQAFGLLIFGWMGITGCVIFVLGDRTHGVLFEMLEEFPEAGEALIPLYLALHVGSVIVHSLAAKPIWRRMWTFSAGNQQKQSKIPGTSNSDAM